MGRARRDSGGPSFARMRAAFETLSDIHACGGQASPGKDRLALSGIPRALWGDLVRRANRDADLITEILKGPSQRESVAGRVEIALAVIAGESEAGDRYLQIAALEVIGRGAIRKSLSVSTEQAGWKEKLGDFTDWKLADAVIACAEGNNQRAAIGIVLLLAGIGRGQLAMLEVENVDEFDESTHMVRGAAWMQAGLPRFCSAAGEALRAVIRIRSVHSRLVKSRKQGLYTAMALAGLQAAGMTVDEIVEATSLPEAVVRRLLDSAFRSDREISLTELSEGLGAGFIDLAECQDDATANSAMRVWRGALLYSRSLDRRIEVARQAREDLCSGAGLIDTANSRKIAMRDLVHVLSVSETDISEERQRFLTAIVDPKLMSRL